jgi:hypothetical protein
MSVKVNGITIKASKGNNSYLTVERTWKNGDVLELNLPMETIAEQLPDKSNWVSFIHGPIVLAAPTTKEDLVGLRADDSRMGHIASGKLMPIDEAPLLVKSDKSLASSLKTVSAKTLAFKFSDNIYQDKYKSLQLIPFYKIHDSRYVIYWPYTTVADLPRLQAEMKLKEAEKMKLEAATVDLVTAGEQQPESDHNFKGENTESGLFREQHYRNGKGWFSYDLRNPNLDAAKLSITYFGAEKNKNFDVYLNDALVSTISLDGTEGDKFVSRQIDVPTTIAGMRNITVTFKAKPESGIAGLYEVRLLRK